VQEEDLSETAENERLRERIGQKIAALEKVRDNIGQVIVGQKDIVEQMLAGLLAGGHCLLEGVPGLGKTLLVKSLAQSLSLDFRRVQFTPDLMPSDLIGTEILEEDHGTGHRFFKFQRGPVFTHILLADEINRTPPKTQAALLEVMQERSVSYAGETHQLQPPFFVLATQNPIELAGTYALPEAQLDRFLMHLRIDYPSEAEEQSILRRTTGTRSAELKAVMDRESMLELQTLTREISVSDAIIDYVARLVRATRPAHSEIEAVRQWVRWGAGPRAGQALTLAAKARALLHGRFAATREDIAWMALPVLRHRILLNFQAEADRRRVEDVVGPLLDQVPAPGQR
jgi:MoxR-like ATPase